MYAMKNHYIIILFKKYNNSIIRIYGYIKITITARFYNTAFFLIYIFIFYYNIWLNVWLTTELLNLATVS